MRLLEFDVNKQRLTKKKGCDFSKIVSGSSGYLHAKFHFTNEWKGCKIAASFWKEKNGHEFARVLDGNNSCVIPTEVLDGKEFYVQVTGMNEDYIIPSTKIRIKQEVK